MWVFLVITATEYFSDLAAPKYKLLKKKKVALVSIPE